MSIFDIIGRLLGLVPSAVQAVESIKPSVVIDPDMPALWHTVTYGESFWDAGYGQMVFRQGAGFCTVCQQTIPKGFANQLCSEAVRRRNAGLS